MEIVIEANAPEPVYEQIVRQVRTAVAAGLLPPGTPLPTVRQLAGDLQINRNTVARAYKALEDQRVIVTARRKGTFVRDDAVREVAELKKSHAERAIRQVVETLMRDGLNRQEISDLFTATMRPKPSKG